jgi:predicted RNA polymerase sigma factor
MKNNKKKHPHWQEEITCFFTSIGWSLPFLGRLSTNRVGRRRRRRKKKSKQVTMKCGKRERENDDAKKKSTNQIIDRNIVLLLLFIFCCCHIDSRNEEREGKEK